MKQESWTVEALLTYLRDLQSASDRIHEQHFASQEKAVNAALIAAKEAVTVALVAAKEAVDKANLASDKRFEAVNEFRAQLADQASTFMPRDLADQRIESIADKISALDRRLTDSITMLSQTASQTQGRREGFSSIIAFGLGFASLLIAATAVAVTLTR